jgi:hypothetical protein
MEFPSAFVGAIAAFETAVAIVDVAVSYVIPMTAACAALRMELVNQELVEVPWIHVKFFGDTVFRANQAGVVVANHLATHALK